MDKPIVSLDEHQIMEIEGKLSIDFYMHTIILTFDNGSRLDIGQIYRGFVADNDVPIYSVRDLIRFEKSFI